MANRIERVGWSYQRANAVDNLCRDKDHQVCRSEGKCKRIKKDKGEIFKICTKYKLTIEEI